MTSLASPLVRRIAKEHDIDLSRLSGSGIGGRVTKKDILAFIEGGGPRTLSAPSAVPVSPAVPVPSAAPSVFRLANDRVEPMTVMRRKIAEHMVLSKHTSAHVYSVFEVNYSRVDQIRRAKKADYEAAGAKLTYTSFIAKAAVDCLRRHETVNAAIDGGTRFYVRVVRGALRFRYAMLVLFAGGLWAVYTLFQVCLLYTSPSPRDS